MNNRIALGRGLEALIPNKTVTETADKKFMMVETDRISPNPMQPRQTFDEERLNELAQSFKTDGIMQPLVVTKAGDNFTVIAGERRLRAAKLAEIAEVPVVVMDDTDDTRKLELALVENIQRENLNPIEVAMAYTTLIEKCGLSHEQLAERVKKSRTAVTNVMRLLSLPLPVQQLVRKGRLTEGHARAILSLPTEEQMLQFAEQIVRGSFSVRETEETVRRMKKRRLIPKRKAPMIAEFETNLKQLLGTSVKIQHGLKKGKIEIEYYGEEDLVRLVSLLKRI
jgi:ParB family chromosome partitioning protein